MPRFGSGNVCGEQFPASLLVTTRRCRSMGHPPDSGQRNAQPRVFVSHILSDCKSLMRHVALKKYLPFSQQSGDYSDTSTIYLRPYEYLFMILALILCTFLPLQNGKFVDNAYFNGSHSCNRQSYSCSALYRNPVIESLLASAGESGKTRYILAAAHDRTESSKYYTR